MNETGNGLNIRAKSVPTRVYFIRGRDAVKIGFSKWPDDRMATLQPGHPEPLEMLGSIPGGHKLEQQIHGRFKHLRLSGEWFRAEPELMDFIRDQLGQSSPEETSPLMLLAEQTAIKLRHMKIGGTLRMLGSQMVCTMRRAARDPELMPQVREELAAFEAACGK